MRYQKRLGRALAAGATAAVSAVTLSACSDGMDSSANVLTITAPTSNKPYYDMLVSEFEAKNPDIDVQVTYVVNEQFPDVLSTQLQGGNASDMFWVATGAQTPVSIHSLGPTGQLVDLSDESWAPTVPPEFRNLVSSGEKLFGAVLAVNVLPVFYNTEAFEAGGYTPPETFDELLTLCRNVADAGNTPIAQVGGSVVGNYLLASGMASSDVYGPDPDFNNRVAAGEQKFSGHEGWGNALGRIVRMNDAGCFSQGVAAAQNDQAVSSFANGNSLMLVGLTTYLGSLKEVNPDLQFSSFAIPADSVEDTRLTLNLGASMGINSDSERIETAKKFYKFLMTEPGVLEKYAETAGAIAPSQYQSGEVPAVLEPVAGHIREGRASLDASLVPAAWPLPLMVALGDSASGLYTDQTHPDEVLSAMDNAIK